jgi:hypothetical protein
MQEFRTALTRAQQPLVRNTPGTSACCLVLWQGHISSVRDVLAGVIRLRVRFDSAGFNVISAMMTETGTIIKKELESTEVSDASRAHNCRI